MRRQRFSREQIAEADQRDILGVVWTTLLRRLKKKPMVAIRLMSTTMPLFQRAVKRP